jgi:Protein of unknown function (DUF2848)
MTERSLVATFQAEQSVRRDFSAASVVIAGWTGRDQKAVQKHIAELAALGVKPPSSTPVFYRVSSSRLTTRSAIEVSGGKTSGEVEFVLLKDRGRLWIGVGSDHTDRDLEALNVSLSKQICEKPIAPEFWAYDEIVERWDSLVLRSRVVSDSGERALYQEGKVSEMLSPEDLLAKWGGDAAEGMLMFGGTLSVLGGIRPARRFEFELFDPRAERRISHAYDVTCLPVVE